MARKGGRGGNKAARSAAAKKGWETRRRGGAKTKPAATKRTAASRPKARPLQSSMARAERVANAASRKQYAKQLKSLPKNARRAIQVERLARRSMQPEMYKPLAGIAEGRTRLIANAGKKRGGLPSAQVQAISRSMASSASRIRELLPKPKPAAKQAAKTTKRRGAPKTTSARGRALTNQRRAADLVRASRGGKGPSAKAVRSVLTAQRARAFYDKTGGGKKRSVVKAKSAAKVGKQIRAQGRAKATAARAKVAGRARAGVAGAKTVLNQDRWKRVAQRVKTRGEVRAYIEGKRPEGYNSFTEKRVFAAYQTRQRAEQFLRGLTRNKSDSRKLASGLAELNSNFQSRRRAGTGSTSIGVAARNRIYDEQRRAKRAENKAARERAAAAAAKPRTVQAIRGRTARLSPRGLLSGPRVRLTGEGGMAMRRVLQSLPTIPRGRRPTSADSSGRSFDTSLSPGVRLGGRQRAALQTRLERLGFSFRSNASGSVQTYSRQFATSSRNPRGQAEILTIQIQKSGKGGLSGGTVSAKRELFVDNRQRNVGGGLIERSLGLPRPRRSRTKPVRRR